MRRSRTTQSGNPVRLTLTCMFLLLSLFLFTAPSCSAYNETKLSASDGTSGDYFAHAVATGAKIVVVGAPYANSNKGAVYIYQYNGNNWAETKLAPNSPAGVGYFGYSVAVSGNSIVVGAPYSNAQKGAIFIYRYNGINWEETRFTASDGAEQDYFGYSVVISGKTVVAGAPYAGSRKGKAYVYQNDGINWAETKLTASGGAEGDLFGYSVALSGNSVIVNAPYADRNKGAVYIFTLE
ncbi:MAG: hypothetical protein A4E66_00427 [Syntrophus sp. PtaB.Bin001]|nr:MAG: hypothetical protein A4E66_00427 [Syntrophus sp. PtaB.Bin001]